MKRFISLTMVLVIVFMTNIQLVLAAPYKTYVVDKDGKPSFSPALYEPLTTIDYEFKDLKDIFIDEKGDLYIAESQRVSVLGSSGEVKVLIDEENLKNATSLHVDDKYIYIADKSDKNVKIFTIKGDFVHEITKPTNPLYGEKENFVPIKIVVNKNRDLFVVSDGNTNGIVQFNFEGDFIGYFGRNEATTDLFQKFREKALSGTALGNLIMVVPPSIQTMDIDEKDIVYASSIGTVTERVRKLNMAGNNIFIDQPVDATINQKIDDIAVQGDFIMMLNNYDGSIIISDKSGTPFGIFGSKTNEIPVTGLFLTPIALEVDNNNNIYVLDNTLNNIQIFAPTALMNNIYEATSLYNNGKYQESKEIWEEILVINPSFAVANDAIGDIEMKNYNYDDALSYYYKSNNKSGYSYALWELRQLGITNYLGIILIFLVVLYIIGEIYSKWFKKSAPVLKLKSQVSNLNKIKFFNDFKILRKIFKKPDYTFYDIRSKDVVSVTNAGIILLGFVFVMIGSTICTNYIFRTTNIATINFASKFGEVFGLVFLFVISNYLIISILDGEGKIGHIFVGTVYALAPIIFFMLPVALVSNLLTLNDVFFYDMLNIIMYGGTLVLIIIMIIEVHNYNFTQSVKVLILTLVTMVILVIISVCLYALFTQIILFAERTIREVVVRV